MKSFQRKEIKKRLKREKSPKVKLKLAFGYEAMLVKKRDGRPPKLNKEQKKKL